MTARFVATVSGTQLTIVTEGRTPPWAVEACVNQPADLSDRLAQLGTETRGGQFPRHLLVRLEGPTLQRRQLSDLPPVRARELRTLVARGASRYFRQNGHPLYGTASWAAGPGGKRRLAHAAAADLDVLEAIVEGAARARLHLEDIVPAPPSEVRLSLLPPCECARRSRAQWRGVAMLGLVVLLLWLLVLGGVDMRRRNEARALQVELTRLKPAAHALSAARLAMDSATAMVSALQAAERGRTRVAGFLGLIVRTLPESAVVSTIRLESDTLALISLRAPRALPVIQALEKALQPGRVAMEAPAVTDTLAGLPAERFTLAIRREEP